MLPLAAADPISKNKVGAARLLRTWVGERRAAVQTQTHAAALGSHEGGSTLQDLPEMMLPYGLYILAHHPDFPQVRQCGGGGAWPQECAVCCLPDKHAIAGQDMAFQDVLSVQLQCMMTYIAVYGL